MWKDVCDMLLILLLLLLLILKIGYKTLCTTRFRFCENTYAYTQRKEAERMYTFGVNSGIIIHILILLFYLGFLIFPQNALFHL